MICGRLLCGWVPWTNGRTSPALIRPDRQGGEREIVVGPFRHFGMRNTRTFKRRKKNKNKNKEREEKKKNETKRNWQLTMFQTPEFFCRAAPTIFFEREKNCGGPTDGAGEGGPEFFETVFSTLTKLFIKRHSFPNIFFFSFFFPFRWIEPWLAPLVFGSLFSANKFNKKIKKLRNGGKKKKLLSMAC